MTTTRVRQFAVTHCATGLVTLVNMTDWSTTLRKPMNGEHTHAAIKAGFSPGDCMVTAVPMGQETPLPFDEIPLILRRKSV